MESNDKSLGVRGYGILANLLYRKNGTNATTQIPMIPPKIPLQPNISAADPISGPEIAAPRYNELSMIPAEEETLPLFLKLKGK